LRAARHHIGNNAAPAFSGMPRPGDDITPMAVRADPLNGYFSLAIRKMILGWRATGHASQ
jgi:hypothetical protein